VSLSADGKRVAIGAPINEDGGGFKAGQVRVYEYTTSSGWAQLGQDIDGEAAYDQLGYSVSLSADGKRVAVGAQDQWPTNDDVPDNPGHVRVYEYTTSSGWLNLAKTSTVRLLMIVQVPLYPYHLMGG
jgi:hypothetical protein